MFKRIIHFLRKRYYFHKFCSVGKNVDIEGKIEGFLNNVQIGDFTQIAKGVVFFCSNSKIRIGNHVMIARDTILLTGNHRTDLVGRYINTVTNSEKRDFDDQEIVICDDVWIGVRCIILKGVTIGEGAIVGAGAVVTKDVEPYSIVAGVPAKKIGMRFNPDELERHLQIIKGE